METCHFCFFSRQAVEAEPTAQRIEDLVDTEDGLLGGTLSTTAAFDTLGQRTLAQDTKRAAYEQSDPLGSKAIPGPMPRELIVPSSQPAHWLQTAV